MKTKLAFIAIQLLLLTACGGSGQANSGAGADVEFTETGFAAEANTSDTILLYLGFDQDKRSGQCSRTSLYTWYVNGELVASKVDFKTNIVPSAKIHEGGHHIEVYNDTQAEWIYDGYIGAFSDQHTLPNRTLALNIQCETA